MSVNVRRGPCAAALALACALAVPGCAKRESHALEKAGAAADKALAEAADATRTAAATASAAVERGADATRTAAAQAGAAVEKGADATRTAAAGAAKATSTAVAPKK